MESVTSMLLVWLLLATIMAIYVVYRLLTDCTSQTSNKHPLYPLVSAKGDPIVPPKGAYFTWIVYIAWMLALFALALCVIFQTLGYTIPGSITLAANALLLTAIALFGIRLIWRSRS